MGQEATIIARNTIKSWFQTGYKPTESQFNAVFDSFQHKDDNVPVNKINGLVDLIKHVYQNLPTYNSIAEATDAIGYGKLFRFSEDNIDGIVSPQGTMVGMTPNE